MLEEKKLEKKYTGGIVEGFLGGIGTILLRKSSGKQIKKAERKKGGGWTGLKLKVQAGGAWGLRGVGEKKRIRARKCSPKNEGEGDVLPEGMGWTSTRGRGEGGNKDRACGHGGGKKMGNLGFSDRTEGNVAGGFEFKFRENRNMAFVLWRNLGGVK